MAGKAHPAFIPVDLGGRRVLQPGGLLWLRSIGWILALIFSVALVYGPSIEFLQHRLPQAGVWQWLGHLLGALLILATYALLVFLCEDRSPGELALKPAPLGLLAGAGLGAVTFSAVMAILIIVKVYDVQFVGLTPAWRSASLALQSAVFEEVLVRAIVFRLVWRAFGPWAALILSAGLFGIGHISNPGANLFTALAIALEAGIMLAAFYALTGRLWVSIGFHAAWNFTQGYVFGAAVSGGDFGGEIAHSSPRSNVPDWLTGGAFGPEASLPAVILCTGLGVTALWFAWHRGNLSSGKPGKFARP